MRIELNYLCETNRLMEVLLSSQSNQEEKIVFTSGEDGTFITESQGRFMMEQVGAKCVVVTANENVYQLNTKVLPKHCPEDLKVIQQLEQFVCLQSLTTRMPILSNFTLKKDVLLFGGSHCKGCPNKKYCGLSEKKAPEETVVAVPVIPEETKVIEVPLNHEE